MKSNTDKVDPNLIIPKTDIDDPKRRNDRRDMELPKHTISRTESAAPNRDKPNTDIVDPRRRKLRRDKEEP
jgi:hypothetical protein